MAVRSLISVVLCVLCLGCSSLEKTHGIMAALERGKAKGHLVLTTDGSVHLGYDQSVYAGLRKTTLSFNGDIDFSDVEEPTPLPDIPE